MTIAEMGSVAWAAGAPTDLTPELRHDRESSIDPDWLIRLVVDHIG